MHAQPNLPSVAQLYQVQQPQQMQYDFSGCKPVKKLNTCELYRFHHQNQSLLLKIYHKQEQKSYEREVSLLSSNQYPCIPRLLFYRPPLDCQNQNPLLSRCLVVYQQATRGDLGQYLRRTHKMGQKMARTYCKKLLQALNSVSQKMKHPNLSPFSVLLTSQGDLKLCGWNNLLSENDWKIEQCLFAVGQIAMCMIIGRSPFARKDLSSDQYYKLLKKKDTKSFWKEIQKSMHAHVKGFRFSNSFVVFIQELLLEKVKSFAQAIGKQWLQEEILNQNEILAQLDRREEQAQAVKQAKLQKMKNTQEKNCKSLHNSSLSSGGQSRAAQNSQEVNFVQDYFENLYCNQQETTSKIKLTAHPAFIIASLKQFLRQENGTYSVLLCHRFILNDHKIAYKKNYLLIDLCFKGQDLGQEDLLQQEQEELVLKIKLNLNKQLSNSTEIQVIESNFNDYYTNVALRLIQERVHREYSTGKINEQ